MVKGWTLCSPRPSEHTADRSLARCIYLALAAICKWVLMQESISTGASMDEVKNALTKAIADCATPSFVYTHG